MHSNECSLIYVTTSTTDKYIKCALQWILLKSKIRSVIHWQVVPDSSLFVRGQSSRLSSAVCRHGAKSCQSNTSVSLGPLVYDVWIVMLVAVRRCVVSQTVQHWRQATHTHTHTHTGVWTIFQWSITRQNISVANTQRQTDKATAHLQKYQNSQTKNSKRENGALVTFLT